MKKCLFAFALLLAANFGFAQDTSEKNLVKTLDPAGATSISFDFKVKEIKNSVWNEGTLRIELNIKANMPDAVLDQLIKAGRYTIEANKNADGKYVISAPNIGKAVTIRGTDLQEEVYIVSKAPGLFIVQGNSLEKDVNAAVVAARAGNGEEGKKAIAKMKAIDWKGNAQVKVKSTLKKQPAHFEIKPGDILIDGKPLDIK